MKKILLFSISLFFLLCSNLCFAQDKKLIDRIGNWRSDSACQNTELNTLIRTKANAVSILEECCPRHTSHCLDSYSGPDNKTLLYTAVEVKAYDVMNFLFELSPNYSRNVDAYGQTTDVIKENKYILIKVAEGDTHSMTPLMLACSRGDLKATKILIEHGASLLKVNDDNISAYTLAKKVKNPDKDFIDYVKKKYEEQESKFGEIKKNRNLKFYPLHSQELEYFMGKDDINDSYMENLL